MSVGILLMTHPGIGTAMLNIARRILTECSLQTRSLEVPPDADMARTLEKTTEMLAQLDQGQGVLVLTDLFGATPNNIARDFAHPGRVAVLAGLNLPMLLRVYNYPDADLKTLCERAHEGATRGVLDCKKPLDADHA